MNTAPSHLRELSLRQLFAAEAVPAAERQHLEHCGECRARLEGLREEQQQFEAEISFERFAGGVERAARETKQAPSSSQATCRGQRTVSSTSPRRRRTSRSTAGGRT